MGADLNAVVHKYYNVTLTQAMKDEALQNDKAHRKRVDKSGSSEMDGWVNGGGWNITYVAGEGVTQKRYESDVVGHGHWLFSALCALTTPALLFPKARVFGTGADGSWLQEPPHPESRRSDPVVRQLLARPVV